MLNRFEPLQTGVVQTRHDSSSLAYRQLLPVDSPIRGSSFSA